MSIIPPALPPAGPARQAWPAWAVPLACLPFAVFLALAVFAYPQTDDWNLRDVALHRGIIGGAWDYLTGWGGRFVVAPFYLVVMSLPWQDISFPLAMAVNILLFPWTLRRMLPRGTPRPWPVAFALAGLLFTTLPSPAQGLYWLAGMLAYVFPLHLVGWAIALARPAGGPANAGSPADERRPWHAAAVLALGVVIAGFGETVAILAGGSALLLASFAWRRAWWLAAGLTVGFAIDMSLPGNWARLAVVHPHGPVLSGPVLAAALHITTQMFARVLLAPECATALLIAALAGAQARGQASGPCTAQTAPPDHRPPAEAGPGVTPISREKIWGSPRPWLAPVVPAMVFAAIIPSIAALGVIEGRQVDTIWIAVLLWSLAGAWWLGTGKPAWFAGSITRPGLVAGCALVLFAVFASSHLGASLPALAIGVPTLALIAWALFRTVHGQQPAWLGLALAALVAMNATFQTAAVDLARNAPARRHAQAVRDRQVRQLAASGARHVRFPLADPDDFPATIATGDILGAGRWDSRDYAACFGLASAGSDPRLDHAIATDADGHALPPGIFASATAAAPVPVPAGGPLITP